MAVAERNRTARESDPAVIHREVKYMAFIVPKRRVPRAILAVAATALVGTLLGARREQLDVTEARSVTLRMPRLGTAAVELELA
jgi:hypothetical protein